MSEFQILEEIQQSICELKYLARCNITDFTIEQLKAQIRGITLDLENNIEILIGAK